jgi:uncharacterized protein YjbI with pentapeptide repeats
MAKCQWKPPEGTPGRDEYSCEHEKYHDEPCCVFHASYHSKKDRPQLRDDFLAAFFKKFIDDKVLKDQEGNFKGFIFPDNFDLKGIDFRRPYERGDTTQNKPEDHKPVDFSWAVFGEEVRLDGATFGHGTKCERCNFKGLTHFDRATFGNQADFRNTDFGNHTSFREAKFGLFAEFSDARFGDDIRFDHVSFAGNAGFERATFKNSPSFASAKFGYGVRFANATFGDGPHFGYANFGDSGHFDYAIFGELAAFISAEFGKDTSFEGAKFGDNARFDLAQFDGSNTRFCSARFGYASSFQNICFNGSVDFASVNFDDQVYFYDTHFYNKAIFIRTSFGNSSVFELSHFHGFTDFSLAQFGDSTIFLSTYFDSDVTFGQTRFGEDVRFTGVEFQGMVSFRHIYGQEKVLYGSAEQEHEEKGQYNSSFKGELFRKGPAHVTFRQSTFDNFAIFQDTDLSRVTFQQVKLKYLSFLNSQISKTNFISCHWGTGPENRNYACWERPWRFAFLRPRLLLDELICRDKAIEEIGTKKSKDKYYDKTIRRFRKEPYIKHPTMNNKVPELDIQPSDIEVLALQLKQSLEATRDPITAGDFHFAVMEMKREQAIASRRNWRAWMLRAYKFISGYGERYGRTALWLLFLLLISSGVFANFEHPEIFKNTASYWERLEPAAFYSLQHVLPFKLGTSVVAVHEKSWLLGWLTVIETIIGTTLFTFFALALRRRFKR